MELDLSGSTVTQAVARIQDALEICRDESLDIKIDNEAVKLNVYNFLRKQGMICRPHRQGPENLIRVKLEKSRRAQRRREGEPAAFPAGHLTGQAEAEPPTKAPPARPAKPRVAAKRQAEPAAANGRRLVIQRDQIGQQDAGLGAELLEAFLERLEPGAFEAIVLAHRGVRLADPRYRQGRPLAILKQKQTAILACARSAAFYGVSGLRDEAVRFLDLGEAVDLGKHDVVWL